MFAFTVVLLALSSLLREAFGQSGRQAWIAQGQQTLRDRVSSTGLPNFNQAKNVILIIPDGYGHDSNFAQRLYEGQQNGGYGEEYVLAHETLPYLAMSKTYNTNAQTPDSAGTASAMNTGVKTKSGVLGVDETVQEGVCRTLPDSIVPKLAQQAKAMGKMVGIVTTARITDATPAAVYASSVDRTFEEYVPQDCTIYQHSIAEQLLDAMVGTDQAGGTQIRSNSGTPPFLDFAMGGGRNRFTSANQGGMRTDGRDLITDFQDLGGRYCSDMQSFQSLDLSPPPPEPSSGRPAEGKIMCLFADEDFDFTVDQTAATATPTLQAMSLAAIEYLSKGQYSGGDVGAAGTAAPTEAAYGGRDQLEVAASTDGGDEGTGGGKGGARSLRGTSGGDEGHDKRKLQAGRGGGSRTGGDGGVDRGGASATYAPTTAATGSETGSEGFFLMIEAARIDDANHAGNLYRALGEGLGFDATVQAVLDATDLSETLVIVTADHSSALSHTGYCGRGSPATGLCFGIDPNGEAHLDEASIASDGQPYTAAVYTTGPGSIVEFGGPNYVVVGGNGGVGGGGGGGGGNFAPTIGPGQPGGPAGGRGGRAGGTVGGALGLLEDAQLEGGSDAQFGGVGGPGSRGGQEQVSRPALTNRMAMAADYMQQALVPLSDRETHSGTDVGIYAGGPWAHLFRGTVEQTFIYYVIMFAFSNGPEAAPTGAQCNASR